MGMRRIIGSKSERAGGLARSQTRRDVAEQLERMNADFADCVAETVDRFEAARWKVDREGLVQSRYKLGSLGTAFVRNQPALTSERALSFPDLRSRTGKLLVSGIRHEVGTPAQYHRLVRPSRCRSALIAGFGLWRVTRPQRRNRPYPRPQTRNHAEAPVLRSQGEHRPRLSGGERVEGRLQYRRTPLSSFLSGHKRGGLPSPCNQ